jgi:hypothetical protein
MFSQPQSRSDQRRICSVPDQAQERCESNFDGALDDETMAIEMEPTADRYLHRALIYQQAGGLSGVHIYQIMPAGHLSPDGGEGWGTDQLVAEAFFSAPAEYISVPTTRNLTPPSHPHYQCGFQRQVLPNPMTTRSLDNFIPPGKPELGDPSGDRSPCEVFILKKIKGWIPKPNR